jgi:hypothetical protein
LRGQLGCAYCCKRRCEIGVGVCGLGTRVGGLVEASRGVGACLCVGWHRNLRGSGEGEGCAAAGNSLVRRALDVGDVTTPVVKGIPYWQCRIHPELS